MTSIAQPAPRRLDAFAVASEPGNERLAISRVAETASSAGISAGRLERLKTAVAEATMNAIEHGNKNHAEIPVDVEIIQTGDEITVAISDQGGAPTQDPASDAEGPDLVKKLRGARRPRGGGQGGGRACAAAAAGGCSSSATWSTRWKSQPMASGTPCG